MEVYLLKIFVEYTICKEYRHDYLQFISKVIKNNPNLEVYEGTDQKNLFVEIWSDCDLELYEAMKNERKNKDFSKWNELSSYIDGGKEKMNIWHFEKLQADN
jgi:hypothetical protein